MSEDDVAKLKWWFCVRQVLSGVPGTWGVEGPFDHHDDATAARKKFKATDMEVTIPRAAASKAEALKICDNG